MPLQQIRIKQFSVLEISGIKKFVAQNERNNNTK